MSYDFTMLTQEIRDYLGELGRKGGRATGSCKRRTTEQARRAGQARALKYGQKLREKKLEASQDEIKVATELG